MPTIDDFKVLELNFNEPKIKLLNLKLFYNVKIEDLYQLNFFFSFSFIVKLFLEDRNRRLFPI